MEFELEGFYERKIYRYLNILIIALSLLLFTLAGQKILGLLLLVLFPLFRTIANKRVIIVFQNGIIKVVDRKVEDEISDSPIKSYLFFRELPGLTKNRKASVTNMIEGDVSCQCSINYPKGTLLIKDIEYLEFQFLSYYLKTKTE